ncbi:MAG: DUF1311 domain-containing protein [Anaerolineae bacterium]|nr:DUF1311 domain-containing protein [Gloeobacterales cyanobacterium ES-bin-313]
MKNILLGLSLYVFGTLVVSSPSMADPCDNAQSQGELNRCEALNFQAADARLNVVYKKLVAGQDASMKQKLVKAQRLWIQFRDANCEYERGGMDGGSASQMIYFGCLAQTTKVRTKTLNGYLQGGPMVSP